MTSANFPTILQVTHLTKRFQGFEAVNDLSFELHEGEILGLLGPNGAGKTTTIQMLLGVLTPTSGEIKYFGKNLAKHRSEVLEQINFSSTYTNLPWDLTVRENLYFVAHLYRLEDRKKQVEEMAKLFELTEILQQPMHELSAGQLTRVNLAKAFLNDPKVLLLDEPTASLDPDVAHYVRSFLLQIQQQKKVAMIITSHNMAEVEEVCDRVIFINHGRLIADDTPTKLAKTINIARVQLLSTKHLETIRKYAGEQQFRLETEGHLAILYLPEEKIVPTLKELDNRGVQYEEISIEPPSLEDYFLQMAGQKN